MDVDSHFYGFTSTFLSENAVFDNIKDVIYLIWKHTPRYMYKTSYGKSSSNVSQFLGDRPELTGTNREKLLSIVQDPALERFVDQVYRPGASVGDGGTADKLIAEFYEGNSRHLPKAKERLNGINKIIDSGNLGLNDLDLAEALRDDLENAIKLFE